MDIEKKREVFENYLEILFQELETIDSCLELWIFINNKREDRIEEMNISPAFFQLTLHSLFFTAIISLAKLYDSYKIKDRSDKNLVKFINFNASNLSIFPTDKTILEKHRCQRKVDSDLINEHRKTIEDKKDILDKLFTWRDKGFAHFDSRYFGNLEKVTKEHPMKVGEIRDLINTASEILNAYSTVYSGNYRIYRCSNYSDIDNILEILHKHKTDYN